MALAEKLHVLRKRIGLSQEQLAERLGVSRQAVSKWESGRAVPESETLVAISEYFGVSLDYLLKDGDPAPAAAANEEETREKSDGRKKRITGTVVCLIGIFCLLAWGLISVFMPSASDRIGESSVVTLDGNGIFLIISLTAIIAGAALLLKSSNDK